MDQATMSLVKNNTPMDKVHTFKVTKLNAYDQVSKTPDNYSPPDLSHLTNMGEDLQSWLTDKDLRDQFALRFLENNKHETAVFWADPVKLVGDEKCRALVYDGAREKAESKSWTELFIKWSTQGSYLATFHGPGIALWGNSSFEKINRFMHAGAKHVEFSPCDRYMATVSSADGIGHVARKRDMFQASQVTASGVVAVGAAATAGSLLPEDQERRHKMKVNVWECRTGALINTFEEECPESQMTSLKWSHDGNFFLRSSTAGITLFSMQRKAEKQLKLPDVREVQWSPSRNIISYVLPGKNNQPSTVALFDIGSMSIVREKHYFNLAKVSTNWQDKGAYFAVRITRNKTKKTFTYTLDIFRAQEKSIPIEEIQLNAAITRLAFDPVNPAFVTTSQVTPANSVVSHCEVGVYNILPNKIDRAFVVQLPLTGTGNAEMYHLYFSPAGRRVVVAAPAPGSGQLTFIDTQATSAAFQVVAQEAHEGVTHIEWDPSGRYLATAVCRSLLVTNVQQTWRDKIEDNYMIWTFQGRLIQKVSVEKLYQFVWRPRPPILLTPAQQEEVKATLKDKYWKKFDAEADELKRATQNEYQSRRHAIKQAWKQMKQQFDALNESTKELRRGLRNGVASDEEDLMEIQVPVDDSLYMPSPLFVK